MGRNGVKTLHVAISVSQAGALQESKRIQTHTNEQSGNEHSLAWWHSRDLGDLFGLNRNYALRESDGSFVGWIGRNCEVASCDRRWFSMLSHLPTPHSSMHGFSSTDRQSRWWNTRPTYIPPQQIAACRFNPVRFGSDSPACMHNLCEAVTHPTPPWPQSLGPKRTLFGDNVTVSDNPT